MKSKSSRKGSFLGLKNIIIGYAESKSRPNDLIKAWKRNLKKHGRENGATIYSPYLSQTLPDLLTGSLVDPEKCAVYTTFNAEVFQSKASDIQYLKKLKERGISLYCFRASPHELHAKILIIPGRFVSIGSQNFTRKGAHNLEASIFIEGDNPEKIETINHVQSLMEAKSHGAHGRHIITLEMINDMIKQLKTVEKQCKERDQLLESITNSIFENENKREDERKRQERLEQEQQEREKQEQARLEEHRRNWHQRGMSDVLRGSRILNAANASNGIDCYVSLERWGRTVIKPRDAQIGMDLWKFYGDDNDTQLCYTHWYPALNARTGSFGWIKICGGRASYANYKVGPFGAFENYSVLYKASRKVKAKYNLTITVKKKENRRDFFEYSIHVLVDPSFPGGIIRDRLIIDKGGVDIASKLTFRQRSHVEWLLEDVFSPFRYNPGWRLQGYNPERVFHLTSDEFFRLHLHRQDDILMLVFDG